MCKKKSKQSRLQQNRKSNQIKPQSMPLDFRKAPKGGRTDFSRSHLHTQIFCLSPRALYMVFLQLGDVHLAGTQESSPFQVFLPFSIQSGNCGSRCPSPIRRSTGKAACQSHSLNHPQVVQCCVHKILLSNSLFP